MKAMNIKYLLVPLVWVMVACAPVTLPWVYPFDPDQLNKFFPSKTATELKTLQIRKFNKPSAKVYEAIKSDCLDRGGQLLTIDQCIFKDTGRKYAYFDFQSKTDFLYLKYKYELTDGSEGLKKFRLTNNPKDLPKDLNQSTIVRLRVYFDSSSSGQIVKDRQITDNRFYADQFKRLGDVLFENAIELNPQTIE
jgi:hypothetical protein